MSELAHVHRLSREGPGLAADAAAEKVLAGSGAALAWNAFSDAGGRFHVGQWQHGPGRLAVNYAESELCVILEGRVRLTDSAGAEAEFGPGAAFVIAAGFGGTWESIGRVTKIYAILEPA